MTSIKDFNINRLNYIGSKFQLLQWIEAEILSKTNLTSFKDIKLADLFSGTGIVSLFFNQKGAEVISNDAELYSSIITKAYCLCQYTDSIKEYIEKLNTELREKKYTENIGFITRNYSLFEENERMFFTLDNALRIDYLRRRIEEIKSIENEETYIFLLACLILSADSVSNVPAVYGCFLKKFKAKAEKEMILKPIHTNKEKFHPESKVYNKDILEESFLNSFETEIVYIDPPYNERQYSKNYFPLNMIALSPEETTKEILKGKTGIPESCFLSSFCRKTGVEKAFEKLFSKLKTKWIFLSYNSESLIAKNRMIEIMEKYGEVSYSEKEYKRFKSFEYNEDSKIYEYLFCLKKY